MSIVEMNIYIPLKKNVLKEEGGIMREGDEMKYDDIKEGQWVEPVSRRGYKLCCCDCGLVHRFNFRVTKGRLQFQAFRDNRATGQMRRHRK